MPLWRIFSHPSTFSPSQRRALSKDITTLYTNIGLPAFYVNVIFIDIPDNGIYIGGEPRSRFVRIAVEHIARKLPNPDAMKAHMEKATALLKPHIADRGLDWEHHVYETPRELWYVQGVEPPPPGS